MLAPVESPCGTGGVSLTGTGAEEYLISRSSCSDPYESDAWLLTAKTLFPGSFSVQFAIYAMYKESQRYAEAATQLTDLLVAFGREPALWPEMRLIAAGATAGEQTTLSDLFTTRIRIHNYSVKGNHCHSMIK